MSSFACGVFLLLTFINVLEANINVDDEKRAFIENKTKNDKHNSIILKYKPLLQKRNKLNQGVKNVEEFWTKRNKLADLEVKQLLGNSLPLDENELEANKIILSLKYQEYDKVFDSNAIFPPTVHFLQAKELIEQSEIFDIIKKIPKGANIYSSLLTSVDTEFLYQLTFESNLYFRFDDKLHFNFSRTKPGPDWRLLSVLRKTNGSANYIQDVNNAIKENLCMVSTKPWKTDPVTSLKKFFELIRVRLSLTKYRPNFIKAFKRALENLYEDNIMYAELNYQFPELYDLEGRTFDPVSVLRLCKIVLDDFKKTHKDFIGVRFYYVSENKSEINNITEFRKIAKDLWKANPNLIAGVALAIHKEPLADWVEELLKFPKEMKLFINTGFTNNWGVDFDYSLLDALVVSPASLGEAYAISKHPFVLEELRKQDIPIKFCPILAQTMNFVKDLRNHPLNVLMATNYPVVVGNLGAGVVNSTGLSHNWYEAYMAMTPKFCDIRCLKQFAINSWIYSSLSAEDKKNAILAWEEKWNEFVEDLIIDSDYKKL